MIAAAEQMIELVWSGVLDKTLIFVSYSQHLLKKLAYYIYMSIYIEFDHDLWIPAQVAQNFDIAGPVVIASEARRRRGTIKVCPK